MPLFTQGTSADLTRVVGKTASGFNYRQPFREALENLRPGVTLELSPNDGENIRKLKTNITWAAHEVNVKVSYGETTDGTLLVWLKEERKRKVA